MFGSLENSLANQNERRVISYYNGGMVCSFLFQKRNEPKKGARQSASSCVFIVQWGKTFFASSHCTINTPAHLGTGYKDNPTRGYNSAV